MQRFAIITGFLALLCLAFFQPLLAQGRRSDYQGRVYTEIRIDDRGIILIDSTGNELMLSGGGIDEGIDSPDIPRPPVAIDADFNPDDYPVKISGISKIGQSVTVEEDEHVTGNVAAIGGNVTIKGLVEGAVTSTGTVRVTSTGIVLGTIIAQEVFEDQGSRVYGVVNERDLSASFDPRNITRSSSGSEEAGCAMFVFLSLTFIFTFAVAMIFRKATDRVKTVFEQSILKALVVGMLAWILILPGILLLCITIIGLLLVPFVPFAMIAAALLGGAAFSLFIAELLKPKDPLHQEGRVKKLVVGFAMLQVPAVAFFIGLIIDSEPLAIVGGIIALLLNLVIFTLGFGATILTRFGSRDYNSEGLRVHVSVSHEEPHQ
jgi:hypothetical protein